MYLELKESKPHGTKEYPYTQYHIHKKKEAFHIPVHWHDEVEIIFVRKGNLRISIEGNIYEAVAGETYLVNPGELHYMETDTIPVDYYTILFSMDFISSRTQDMLEMELLGPLREKKKLLVQDINSVSCVKKIEQLLGKMIDLNDRQEGAYQLRTKGVLMELLSELVEAKCFYTPVFRKNSNLQREMISYIQEHFSEKITLKTLGDEFHLSEKYISRYFKDQFSISFMQYVAHLRIEKAKKMLRETENSVMEVALSCGYPSVNFFIRSFKEANEMTPLQYRKQIRT